MTSKSLSQNPKKTIILGSTGSIGQSACRVARDIPERMEIVGLGARRSVETLAAQANEFRPRRLAICDEECVKELKARLAGGYEPEILIGEAGMVELAGGDASADLALIAIVGTGGLRPALAAVDAGLDLAVASKEILVMAGEILMAHAAARGVTVLPVDSEHNAIFQCLQGLRHEHIKRIILTASGGPFRCRPAEELEAVTISQALKHPTWKMGQKITIDSATLFNKGLEMIEARWLFGLRMDQVDVVVHPQSIVHSMVETLDHSVLAQLSHSDMCFPIQYAVTFPDRVPNSLAPLDFAELSRLDFEPPRRADFPALDLAHAAGEGAGILPAVLNAANEVAVEAFLEERIAFPEIWRTVEAVLARQTNIREPELDVILQADAEARRQAGEVLAAASF